MPESPQKWPVVKKIGQIARTFRYSRSLQYACVSYDVVEVKEKWLG